MDYPVWDVAMGGPLLMAIVAVTHVIVSHFAIGGGLVIAVTETLSVRRADRELRELARRGSLVLILVSTVFGAISGVGIWVVAGLIAPGAISALIHNYVWGWAMEWVFFILEIVAALVYYATWDRISKGAHLLVGWLYFVAAYMSLVIINGIITFQLTPGRWLQTRGFWDGFFNPTYFPALVLRTGIVAMMATAFLVFPALKASPEARPRLLRYLGWWMAGGSLVAYAGYRLWEAALPANVRALFLGGEALLPQLAATRHVLLWALALTLALAAVLLLAAPRTVRAGTAAVLALAAFTFFAGYERLREGVRKPYLIHDYMFSNGLRVDQIETLNAEGIAAHSGWVAAARDAGPEEFGAAIFRAQCRACHTLDGYQSIRRALPTRDEVAAFAAASGEAMEALYAGDCRPCHRDTPASEMHDAVPAPGEIRDDPEMVDDLVAGMISGTLENLREMGAVYAAAHGRPVDLSRLAHPYMPPFVGSEEERDALADYLTSLVTPAPGEKGGA